MRTHLRLIVVLILLALLGAACAGVGRTTRTPVGATALPQIAAGPHEHVPTAIYLPTGPGLPQPLVNPEDLRPGGPPPDGIPAIDHPKFERTDAVTWIHDQEPVLAFTLNGESRAYPVQVLIWHEIVNDTVANTPVSVTFCPLCNSALAFDRRAANRILSFGTSGKLYNSDLVMYDRQTESLWPQFLGQAVAGMLTGTKLTAYPVQTVSWKDWRTGHPHDWVLSRNTGFNRDYGTNPYPGYDDIHSTPFLFNGKVNGRYAPMTHVVGIQSGTDAVAIPVDTLRLHPVIETTVNGQPVDVWFTPGTGSPLQGGTVAGGQDIGSTGTFSPITGGRHLHFTATGTGFRDSETGSTWTVLGHATTGPLAGTDLPPIAHVDTFWFAWAAFLPNSRVIDAP